MALTIKSRDLGDITVLELKGSLLLDQGAATLDETIQKLATAGCKAILLETSNVSFIDSEGLRVLVRSVASLERRGGCLRLLRLSPRVRQILEATRLVDAIGCFDDEATALQTIRGELAKGSKEYPEPRNRRDFTRVPIDILTQVEQLGKSGTTLGRASNISEGGLRVNTRNTLKPPAEVDIRLNLPPFPPGRPIEAKGVVVHEVPGKSMGIEFVLINDTDRKAIRSLVDSDSD